MKLFGFGSAVLVLFSIVAVSSGCSTTTFTGSCTEVPGRISCEYSNFDGVERNRINVSQGETIDLGYEATVEEGDS